MLQRFAQLIEQSRVLDGDDSLRGEVFHQIDLFVGERAHLLAHNVDHANQFIVSQHRYTERSSESAEFNSVYDRWMSLDIGLDFFNVLDMNDLLCD